MSTTLAPITLLTTHDPSNHGRIKSRLAKAGYPIGDGRVVQIPVPSDPDFRPGHDEWEYVVRRIVEAPADEVYINWEYPDHNAWHAPNTPGQIRVKIMLAEIAHAAGKKVGMYNPIRVHLNARRSLSESSLYNYRRLHEHFDFITLAAYITRDWFEEGTLDRPQMHRYFSGLSTGLRAIEACYDAPRVYTMFQLPIRPTGTSMRPMPEAQAGMMAQALAGTRSELLWWFEATDEFAIGQRLNEAIQLRPSFTQGLIAGTHAADARPTERKN